jgi:hypothetical protein
MRSRLRTFPYLPFTLVMTAGLALFAIFTNTYFTQIIRHWINRIGFAPRDFWYMRFERDVGPSAGYFACLGLLSA